MSRFSKIFVLSALILLAACQAPTTYRPELTPEEIRAEQQAQQQMVDEISAQGGSKKNWKGKPDMRKQFERVASKIEEAGAEICREMGVPQQGGECYYHFRIKQEDDVINAYADGENIVVNTAMLKFLQSDDELAAILGHEFAHNLMGHVDAGMKNTMAGAFVGLLLDAAAASQGINTQGGFTQSGADMGRLTYSVEFEEEADYVGLYVASRAGYDVNKMPMVWRRMSIENPDAIYNARTHPSNAARFVALQKTIDEINYKRKHKVAMLPDIKTQAE
ncbi:MAG: M48 family metallopeptidase [Alphaproteobacteria bacterium]